jgi:hypothetical protein
LRKGKSRAVKNIDFFIERAKNHDFSIHVVEQRDGVKISRTASLSTVKKPFVGVKKDTGGSPKTEIARR